MIKIVLLAAVVIAVLAWLGRARRPTMTLTEARATLGVTAGADEGAVRSAHRQLIARVHPDAGGTEGLAQRANLARDTLLADLATRSPE